VRAGPGAGVRRRPIRVGCALAIVVLTLLQPLAAPAAEPPRPATPGPAAIPVAQVATRAAEVSAVLRELASRFRPSFEIEAIRKALPGLRHLIDLEAAAATSVLQGEPSLDMLQAQQVLWQEREMQSTRWLTALTERATLLDEALGRLAGLRETWLVTREGALVAKAPEPVLGQIGTVLGTVEALEKSLAAERADVLDLQGVVAREVARSGEVVAELNRAQELAVGGLLSRENEPLWSREAWAHPRGAVSVRSRQVAAVHWADIRRYAGDPQGLALHVTLLAVLAVLLALAGHRVRRWPASAEGRSPALAVFDHPYASTVVAALLAIASPYALLPGTVRNLFVILGLAAAIRLTKPMVDRRIVPDLYVLWGLLALDRVRGAFAGIAPGEQVLLCIETIAGIAALTYSVTRGGLRSSPTPWAESGSLSVLRFGVGLVVFGLAIALIAGVAGYMRLARLLAAGILGSGALAMTLQAGARVVIGVIAFALRVWPLRLLNLVREHRDLLERRAGQVLVWLAVIGWMARTLDYVGLLQMAFETLHAILGTELGRGSIRISVGNLLEFAVTVWLAYLFSAFVRFVLREEIYPRTHVTRGLSYAISSLINYAIIALGFVLALGVLGIDLNKLTILAGAFGVGIGFGLQSVVNNFVSGLILLFERPIHVGDIVDVGDLSGEVVRIGIRASTVRTWQGAEIIVPNAQLITERVTNWTLSDRTRRIDLSVGVDYASAPERVVEVLEAVAQAHPQILKTPPPQAVFQAFGDSSINFQLRAWTNRFERWPKIQTELAAAVYDALHAAGMSLPFPQREVRLLQDHKPDPGK